MKPEFLSIGHVVCDLVGGQKQAGGSALYSAKTAQQQGFSCGIFTSADPNFPDAVDTGGIAVRKMESHETTTFIHSYDPGSSRRISRLQSLASPLNMSFLPQAWRKCPMVLLCPNWDEITPVAIHTFETPFLALSPQGWFRARDTQGNVVAQKSLYQNLPRQIALIVISEEDLCADRESWQWMKEQARVAVRTAGKKGYCLSIEGQEKEYPPPFVADEVDPTGAGDVFAASLLIGLYQGIEPKEAAFGASIAASFVVESPGTLGVPSKEQVLARWERVAKI